MKQNFLIEDFLIINKNYNTVSVDRATFICY